MSGRVARLARRFPPPRSLRKRLLTVGPIPPEWGGRLRGGVTRFNVTLLDEFRRHPWHRVEPLGVLIPPPQRVHRRLADERSPLPVFMQPEGARPRRFTRTLLERERPDVILLNNLAAFNGARFARVQREVAPDLPVIAVVHEWRAIRTKGGERGRRYSEAAQAGLDSVAAVVFPSQHTRDLGRDELALRYPERALVIPNPLQPAFAAGRVDVAGPRHGVAFVGSYNERKNPGSLLRAAAAADFELVMQGRGPLEDDLRALSEELGLGERVTFAPFVKSKRPKRHVAAVIDVMRSAELVCLPSLSESFGLVMIEALAAGAPVAGFGPTLREIRDQLGIDVGEPLDDPTPENVGAAIEAIRGRNWDRERLRRAALSEFSAAAVARRYASLIREVGR